MSAESSMNNDHLYAEVLEMMRQQGCKDNPTTLQLGIMQSSNKVKIDDLILNAGDLYIAEDFMKGYKFPLVDPYVKDENFKDGGQPTETEENAVRSKGLQKGDLVAVMKLQNTNKYVILAKVVQA
jgi:hypothetical protein